MPKLHQAVANARREAVAAAAKQVHFAEFNARLMRSRADDAADPVGEDIAIEHEEAVEPARATAARVAKANDTTIAKALAGAEDAFRREIEGHLTNWENERAVHQDLLDNPDAYGGVMLDGQTPINPEKQREHLKALDAAIEEAQRTLELPAPNRATRRAATRK